MISKRTTYILCALMNLTFATQTMHAGLWQTICSPFASMAKYIQQRPLISAAAALGTLAISGGIYWWYKARASSSRKTEAHNVSLPNKRLDAQNRQSSYDEVIKAAIERVERVIHNFQNTKDLLRRSEKTEGNIFYAQLNDFLPLIRRELNPTRQVQFDALKFGETIEGSADYWDACAKLFFYLDDYIAGAQKTLKRLRNTGNRRV